MRALVLLEPGRLVLEDRPEPDDPGPGEATVRVRRVGVCGTDLHAYRGEQPLFTYPRLLGHELGVEVVAVGAGVDRVAVGDRCAVEPYLHCGRCVACRAGRTNCCAELKVLGVHVDGGMRPTLNVPAAKLHRSNKLSDDQLALVETLCIGAHAVARAAPRPGEPTLVVGAGPIGLGVIQFAHAAGADVTVLDLRDDRRAFVREQLGIAAVVGTDEALADAAPEGFTAVFDATGHRGSMARALDRAAPTARVVYVGLVLGGLTLDDPTLHRKELTLLASRNATAGDFARVVAAVEAGDIDTAPWITHRAALDDAPSRFDTWLDPASGTVKAMIELD